MQWIIPCDLNYYDIRVAIEKLHIIDLRQNNSFNIDDIVYIYASAPYQKIMFKTRVVDVKKVHKSKRLMIETLGKFLKMKRRAREEKALCPITIN